MNLLNAIVRWSLANRAVVLVATLLLIALGVRAGLRLPIDAVPDVTNIQVQIITTAPALAPVEVEQYVTVPVERAMAGLPRTTEVRSISKYGLSVVTVVFEDGTDIWFARQVVSERMREATDAVPRHYGAPEMGPVTTGLGEILQFTIENPKLSLMQLEELLDWQVRPQLRSVPGVVEVNSFGGQDRQYQVVLDPLRLQALGVSVAEVVAALEKSNANAGGGYIEHARQQTVIGTDGLVRSLADLRNVVVTATAHGVPITVGSLGDVQFGPRLRRGAASKDGTGEVVVGTALMQMAANSRTVTQAVKQRLTELAPSLPAGTTLSPFYDRSLLVDRTIGTVLRNLAEGATLVVLVLFLLLGNLRAGLVVAVTIPLSLLVAVTAMDALGLSGNLMSLGAIDFGLIVDGAVIIVENATRRLGEARRQQDSPLDGAARLRVVEAATLEVRTASVFGEAIIALVYVPILALTSTEGKLFRPMATTVLLALAGAFVLSLTVVPVLTALFVRPAAVEHEPWLLRPFRWLYGPVLRWSVRWPWPVMVGATGLLVVGALLFTRIGAEFIPQLDEGDLLIEARRLPGVALSESVATDLRLQKAVKTVPEVAHVVSKTGAPELATDPMGVEQTDVFIALKSPDQWRPGLSKADLGAQILAAFDRAMPDVGSGLSQPIEMRTGELVAGIRSDVAAMVYGRDLDELLRIGNAIAAKLRPIAGIADVKVEQVSGLPYLRVRPDRNKLARHGLSIADVNQLTETFAVGADGGTVLEGERQFGIRVLSGHGYRGDPEVLSRLPLKTATGQLVPLGDVAELQWTVGPAEVQRKGQSRRLLVEFNVRDRDLLSVVREAQAAVDGTATAAGVTRPAGYRVVWGGQFQHYLDARDRLGLVVPLALALIFFLLWLAFRSLSAAALIFLAVPFAAVGGVVALWLRDIPFSISAGVGFVALFGVAVLNGLVLIAFCRQVQSDEITARDAIVHAARLRLRPVVMTALVASLGFLPMALSTAPGAEVQRPLATVVIGGLVTATLLTLVVVPAVYARFFGRSRRNQMLPLVTALALAGCCGVYLEALTARDNTTPIVVAATPGPMNGATPWSWRMGGEQILVKAERGDARSGFGS